MPKILFVAQHRPDRSPGQRYRFEQFLGHLMANGFDSEVSFIVNEADDKILYQRGNQLKKADVLRRSVQIRKKDVARMNEFDIIFIYREALMTGSTRFERAFRKSNAKLVLDFDDTIWLKNTSRANKRWDWMKNASKTDKLIGLVDLVIVGNDYLAEHARAINPNTVIIPSTIDTDRYDVRSERTRQQVCIGWSGSVSTIPHFERILPVFRELKKRYGETIRFKVIGQEPVHYEGLEIETSIWSPEQEAAQLHELDIGIMPLPDDKWSRGKCGMKGLQYMGVGIPAVLSPVGVNTDIIEDGINGFLADSEEDWIEKLGILIENADLRRRMGTAARITVEERFSVNAWKDNYVNLFKELIA
jgi:glycosyltransferase involved in cell wall biosynthesis